MQSIKDNNHFATIKNNHFVSNSQKHTDYNNSNLKETTYRSKQAKNQSINWI